MTKLTLNLSDPDFYFLEEKNSYRFPRYSNYLQYEYEEDPIIWSRVKSPLELLLAALEVDE